MNIYMIKIYLNAFWEKFIYIFLFQFIPDIFSSRILSLTKYKKRFDEFVFLEITQLK